MAYLFGVPNHDFLVGAVGSRMWLWGVVYYEGLKGSDLLISQTSVL